MARASAFQAEGRGFESRFPLQNSGYLCAHIAQEVEHFLGKEEVSGSSPDVGSINLVSIAILAVLVFNKTPEKEVRGHGQGEI